MTKASPPPWSPTASRAEARDYLEQRLRLFARLLFWIFWILVAFIFGLYTLHGWMKPKHARVVDIAAITGLAAFALVWWLTLVRRRTSIEGLYIVDAAFAIGIGGMFGIAAAAQYDLHAAGYTALIWHTFMVVSRALLIPSSARRTAIVSAASFVPIVGAGAVIAALASPAQLGRLAPDVLVVGTALYSAVAVVIATTGSRVIYGLRREVFEARQLGQYTLDEKIGEGGMGTVYRARHAMLRRPTAIKLLPPDKLGAESVRRFEREVQHMSRLTHPNAVAIFDYGRSPDGIFYYAMELLDGVNLETLVRREGPQPAARVVHVLEQVCGALDEAHAMGLTHRDVKPGNIILCRRGRETDVAKVVDFGLVKEVKDIEAGASSEAIAGTPAYLAPEAITDPSLVGPHSDLYALGAVGYFLVTGQRVFDGKSAVELCVQHATEIPVPPSQRTDRPVPPDLEALILACLAKSPSERPVSAHALALALRALPDYPGWDDDTARAWWDEFDARRHATPPGDDARLPLTITIDVIGRTMSSGED